MLREFEKNKIDLHLHLDGSLPLSVIPKLAELSGISIEESKIPELFSLPAGCRNLVDYLKCFDMPGQLLQTKECLSLACEALVKEIYADHVMLAEIRFAPQLHMKKGLNGNEVVEAAIEGMQKGLAQCPGMQAGLILCMMVNGSEADNMETVLLTREYLGEGVIALDIAGPEGMIPMEDFTELFLRAKQLGIPYTIHAGECGDYHNIEKALHMGASRIGHGVAAIYSDEVIIQLLQTGTPVEICVTSNLQTNAIPPEKMHPVKALLDAGVCVTINTDNMTVSNTNLTKEYALLMEKYDFTESDIMKVQENARKASFLNLKR